MNRVINKKTETIFRTLDKAISLKVSAKNNLVKNSMLIVPTSDTIEFVKIEDIIYLKSEGNYCHFYLADDEKIFVSKTLKYFVNALSEYNFLRIHQSYFVKVSAIKKYVKKSGGYLILRDGKEIPVSRKCRQNIINFING